MVGYEKWSGQEFEIVQDGSHSWKGKVTVWNFGSGSHGRKSDKSANGDWKKNDTIKLELQHCKAVQSGKRGNF